MQSLWLGVLGAIIPWQSSPDDLQTLLCSAFCQCWEQEACWVLSAWRPALAPSVSPGARPVQHFCGIGDCCLLRLSDGSATTAKRFSFKRAVSVSSLLSNPILLLVVFLQTLSLY